MCIYDIICSYVSCLFVGSIFDDVLVPVGVFVCMMSLVTFLWWMFHRFAGDSGGVG